MAALCSSAASWEEIGHEEADEAHKDVDAMLTSDLANLDAPSQAALGHAMARTARLLLQASSSGQANGASYEPYVSPATLRPYPAPASQSSEAATHAATAAAAAHAAHSAHASAAEAARRRGELATAAASALNEADESASRLRAALAREELLSAQLEEVRAEAEAVDGEVSGVEAMVERRRMAADEDEAALEAAAGQVAAERLAAQESLAEAIERLTSARALVEAIEREAAGGVVPREGETVEESQKRHAARVAQLDDARSRRRLPRHAGLSAGRGGSKGDPPPFAIALGAHCA